MDDDVASFEVTGHYEMAARGAFVIGHIRTGAFRIGECLEGAAGQCFTISGIEYLSGVSRKDSRNALMFREKPTIEAVVEAFPVGTTVRTRSRQR